MNIVDFFDNLRFWGNDRNKLLQKLRFYGFVNKTIEISANIILPLYFNLTKNNTNYRIIAQTPPQQFIGANAKIIVSLTSFPKRIPTLYLVIESILRQTVKPDKLILHLTKSQVKDIELLPKRLLELRKRGLEIVLCPDNIRYENGEICR